MNMRCYCSPPRPQVEKLSWFRITKYLISLNLVPRAYIYMLSDEAKKELAIKVANTPLNHRAIAIRHGRDETLTIEVRYTSLYPEVEDCESTVVDSQETIVIDDPEVFLVPDLEPTQAYVGE